MLRIYSSEHKRQISAFWDFLCKETNNKIKNTMFLLNMVGRKPSLSRCLSPKEDKRTSYLEKEYSRQRKQQMQKS